jgi:hypothetical protein
MPSIATDRPLKEAVATLARKTPVGLPLTSAEIDLLPGEFKLRAMLSARVEDERLLAEMQERLQARIELAKKDGRTMDRGVFIEEMRAELRKAGYKRGDAKRGSLQDLKSTRRLGLIWDMNVAQAQGYAQWQAWMTDAARLMVPCLELVRVRQRMEHRNWPEVWARAGGEFFGQPGPDYPAAPGRMIAAKDDPIWQRISRFGTPWPPFDWGSGMGLKPIRRMEAEALGVLGPEDLVAAVDTPFNDGAKASLKGIPEAGRKRIVELLAGDVEILGEEIRIIPPESGDAMAGRGKKRMPAVFDGVNRPAPKPAGRPLAEVVTVRGEHEVAKAIRRGITAADRVHGDGLLPMVEVAVRTPVFQPWVAGDYQPVTSRAGTPLLRINPNAIHPEFATLHELGHLIDNLGLHTPDEARLYASEGQPDMRELMREIRKSTAAGRLAAQVPEGSYLLSAREFFARAYAQYIAERAGSAGPLEFIREIREGAVEEARLYRHSQWSWADFNSISRAMWRLFTKGGWKSGR